MQSFAKRPLRRRGLEGVQACRQRDRIPCWVESPQVVSPSQFRTPVSAPMGCKRGGSRRLQRRVGCQVTARCPERWYSHATTTDAFTNRKKPAKRGHFQRATGLATSAVSPNPYPTP